MGLVMEALADGGVLVGIPRPMADKIAAYTMMVRREGEREGKDVLHSSFSLEHSKDGDREENQTTRSKPLLPTSCHMTCCLTDTNLGSIPWWDDNTRTESDGGLGGEGCTNGGHPERNRES